VLLAKIGEKFNKGDTLGMVHANDVDKLAQAQAELLAALSWSDEAVKPLPHFYGTIQ
jgi:thymidine phosphorylase